MSKITSEIDCISHGTDERLELLINLWLSVSVFEVISSFSYQISTVKKQEKLILFVYLDSEFHILKLLFEDFLPKIIREAGNCESLILRVKFLCLNYGGTHGISTG